MKIYIYICLCFYVFYFIFFFAFKSFYVDLLYVTKKTKKPFSLQLVSPPHHPSHAGDFHLRIDRFRMLCTVRRFVAFVNSYNAFLNCPVSSRPNLNKIRVLLSIGVLAYVTSTLLNGLGLVTSLLHYSIIPRRDRLAASHLRCVYIY